MRCSLGSIPLCSGQDPSLVYIQPSAFSSLVNPDGSNIRLKQHLKFRPFWLARRSRLQIFESPRVSGAVSGLWERWPFPLVATGKLFQFIILESKNDISSSPLTVHKFKEKEIGREALRRWKEIEDPERKQKEWVGCERTKKKQEKAKAVKVSKYKIKCLLFSDGISFLFSSSLLLIGVFQREAV